MEDAERREPSRSAFSGGEGDLCLPGLVGRRYLSYNEFRSPLSANERSNEHT